MNQLHTVSEADSRVWPQILILEDEATVAEGLRMVLREGGYTADLKLNGHDALEAFKQKNHDLLITDLKLPDIDGMEVVRQVKHDHPDTGVIVITGYSTIPSAVEAMKLGAFDYLPKPFTEDEIMVAVRNAIDAIKMPEAIAPPQVIGEEPLLKDIQLVAEDQARVDAVLTDMKEIFPGKADDVIPMLQFVQDKIGYLPANALEALAHLIKRPTAAVFGVATFYEQFRLKPVGKHIVKVCRGTACHVKGADRILNEISSKLHVRPGQTSDDKLLTLQTVACFGSCAIAPVVVVDDHVKGRMNPSKTLKMMNQITQDASENI